VLEQTFSDFELLIVDDGSTDDTQAVLEPFLKDKRVRYFRQGNQGQSHARNYALRQAKGEFIGFLDSDDLWFPEKLRLQIQAFRAHKNVGIVHGDEVLIDAQGDEISRQNMKRFSGRITSKLLADNSVSITTALVRRECFEVMGGFDTSLAVADDYELWLRLSTRFQFHYEPGYVAYYRVMDDQISTDKNKRFQFNEKIINDFLLRYPNSLSLREKLRGKSQFFTRKARYRIRVGGRKEAIFALFKAIIAYPFWLGPWRAMAKFALGKR
jgi:glycosyltransferase involved in cell wall biosynthesis